MGIKEISIPESITFLDHWLYELRRIYDVTDNNKKEDWLTHKKS